MRSCPSGLAACWEATGHDSKEKLATQNYQQEEPGAPAAGSTGQRSQSGCRRVAQSVGEEGPRRPGEAQAASGAGEGRPRWPLSRVRILPLSLAQGASRGSGPGRCGRIRLASQRSVGFGHLVDGGL